MRPLILLVVALLAGTSQATERSRAMRAEFQRHHPCPSTGKSRGACPGYQVDHVRALCAGGTDHPSNMAWLTMQAHQQKTSSDVGACRARRVGVLTD